MTLANFLTSASCRLKSQEQPRTSKSSRHRRPKRSQMMTTSWTRRSLKRFANSPWPAYSWPSQYHSRVSRKTRKMLHLSLREMVSLKTAWRTWSRILMWTLMPLKASKQPISSSASRRQDCTVRTSALTQILSSRMLTSMTRWPQMEKLRARMRSPFHSLFPIKFRSQRPT